MFCTLFDFGFTAVDPGMKGSDTFFKKGANRDGSLKLSATNKDLNNIKYFKSYIILRHELITCFFSSLMVPSCELNYVYYECETVTRIYCN